MESGSRNGDNPTAAAASASAAAAPTAATAGSTEAVGRVVRAADLVDDAQVRDIARSIDALRHQRHAPCVLDGLAAGASRQSAGVAAPGLDARVAQALRDALLPRATVVVCTLPEARRWLGIRVAGDSSLQSAGDTEPNTSREISGETSGNVPDLIGVARSPDFSRDRTDAPALACRLRDAGARQVCIVGIEGADGRALEWLESEHARGWLAPSRDVTPFRTGASDARRGDHSDHGGSADNASARDTGVHDVIARGTSLDDPCPRDASALDASAHDPSQRHESRGDNPDRRAIHRSRFARHLATALAHGFVAADAAVLAKMAVTAASRSSSGADVDRPPLDPGFVPDPALLPLLSWGEELRFADVADASAAARRPLDLYAIVDSAERVQQVLAAGIRTVQLRIKTAPSMSADARAALRAEVQRSIAACRAADAELFVNDHWQLAHELGATAVHLGQEDLLALGDDGRAALAATGLALGVSTHSLWELCRARSLAPRYVACGPVWPTLTKAMPWRPQGLDNLSWWCRMAPAPVVAIGGILGAEQVREAAACGADGVCVVRGLGDRPEAVLPALQAALNDGRAGLRVTAPAWPHPSLPERLVEGLDAERAAPVG